MSNTIQAKKTGVTDTILRDAHQSLLATRMRTEDATADLRRKLDRVGYWSLEVWGQRHLRRLRALLRKTRGNACAAQGGAAQHPPADAPARAEPLGYRHYSDDVVRAFVAKAAVNGIDVFRIFDAMNDVRNLRVSIEAVKAAGKHARAPSATPPARCTPSRPSSPRGEAMADMGVDSIAIKDMAGLLTPMPPATWSRP